MAETSYAVLRITENEKRRIEAGLEKRLMAPLRDFFGKLPQVPNGSRKARTFLVWLDMMQKERSPHTVASEYYKYAANCREMAKGKPKQFTKEQKKSIEKMPPTLPEKIEHAVGQFMAIADSKAWQDGIIRISIDKLRLFWSPVDGGRITCQVECGKEVASILSRFYEPTFGERISGKKWQPLREDIRKEAEPEKKPAPAAEEAAVPAKETALLQTGEKRPVPTPEETKEAEMLKKMQEESRHEFRREQRARKIRAFKKSVRMPYEGIVKYFKEEAARKREMEQLRNDLDRGEKFGKFRETLGDETFGLLEKNINYLLAKAGKQLSFIRGAEAAIIFTYMRDAPDEINIGGMDGKCEKKYGGLLRDLFRAQNLGLLEVRGISDGNMQISEEGICRRAWGIPHQKGLPEGEKLRIAFNRNISAYVEGDFEVVFSLSEKYSKPGFFQRMKESVPIARRAAKKGKDAPEAAEGTETAPPEAGYTASNKKEAAEPAKKEIAGVVEGMEAKKIAEERAGDVIMEKPAARKTSSRILRYGAYTLGGLAVAGMIGYGAYEAVKHSGKTKIVAKPPAVAEPVKKAAPQNGVETPSEQKKEIPVQKEEEKIETRQPVPAEKEVMEIKVEPIDKTMSEQIKIGGKFDPYADYMPIFNKMAKQKPEYSEAHTFLEEKFVSAEEGASVQDDIAFRALKKIEAGEKPEEVLKFLNDLYPNLDDKYKKSK